MPFPVRSFIRQAAKNLDRADVSPAMRKWWKLGYHKADGLITKTLSPFEQKIMSPLLDGFPTKIYRNYLRRWVREIGPALVIAYGTLKWADVEFERLMREHWD